MLADVVEKHNIPTVKATGGQRITCLAEKEDLPKVWADLDVPSLCPLRRSERQDLRRPWCRFGVQDSTNMGIELRSV